MCMAREEEAHLPMKILLNGSGWSDRGQEWGVGLEKSGLFKAFK